MNLAIDIACTAGYKSRCQIARKATEGWGAGNLFCAACRNDRLDASPANTPGIDFTCSNCGARYQLKASAKLHKSRVPDAGFDAMIRAIRSDAVPNLLVMQYSDSWLVKNLLLVPRFFFNESCIERRPPLGPSARRAGWVGCNIRLDAIAEQGKLTVVAEGAAVDRTLVRTRYAAGKPLAQVPTTVRGWTLDVLRVVQLLPKDRFLLRDVYRFEEQLAALRPENRNIRAKIRQQLQVLRDLGIIQFERSGEYRMLMDTSQDHA